MKYPCENMNILISKSFYLLLQVFSVVGIFYYYNMGGGGKIDCGLYNGLDFIRPLTRPGIVQVNLASALGLI